MEDRDTFGAAIAAAAYVALGWILWLRLMGGE